MSKVVMDTETEGEIRQRLMALARRADQGEALPEVDYHLNFADAVHLFSELTPPRLCILETLQPGRTQSISALAKYLGRHYRTVDHDVPRRIQLDLLTKDEAGRVLCALGGYRNPSFAGGAAVGGITGSGFQVLAVGVR